MNNKAVLAPVAACSRSGRPCRPALRRGGSISRLAWASWILLAAGAAWTAPAAALSWTSAAAPHEGGDHGGGHGQHGGGGGPAYHLSDAAGAKVELWLPTLEKRPLQVAEGGRVPIRPTGIDYYHALVATRGNETAVRYIALRGKASNVSPSRLIEAPKGQLEIIPDPYVREHQRYYDGTEAAFRLRFGGSPLARRTVMLETGNGTRLFTNSDASGRVAFTLPSDFQEVAVGRRANPPAEFVVTAVRGDHRFALTAEYHVNPNRWRSTEAGAWSGLAGFVAGLALLGWSRRGRPGGSRA